MHLGLPYSGHHKEKGSTDKKMALAIDIMAFMWGGPFKKKRNTEKNHASLMWRSVCKYLKHLQSHKKTATRMTHPPLDEVLVKPSGIIKGEVSAKDWLVSLTTTQFSEIKVLQIISTI